MIFSFAESQHSDSSGPDAKTLSYHNAGGNYLFADYFVQCTIPRIENGQVSHVGTIHTVDCGDDC
jgi:prepilin-type processing-associated H-X9-DG protein